MKTNEQGSLTLHANGYMRTTILLQHIPSTGIVHKRGQLCFCPQHFWKQQLSAYKSDILWVDKWLRQYSQGAKIPGTGKLSAIPQLWALSFTNALVKKCCYQLSINNKKQSELRGVTAWRDNNTTLPIKAATISTKLMTLWPTQVHAMITSTVGDIRGRRLRGHDSTLRQC